MLQLTHPFILKQWDSSCCFCSQWQILVTVWNTLRTERQVHMHRIYNCSGTGRNHLAWESGLNDITATGLLRAIITAPPTIAFRRLLKTQSLHLNLTSNLIGGTRAYVACKAYRYSHTWESQCVDSFADLCTASSWKLLPADWQGIIRARKKPHTLILHP